MKKTFKTMLALMAGAVAFTACSNDDIIENVNEQKTSALKPMTFTASMEGQDGASRATIDGLDIKWEAGDKISIFDGGDADTDGNLAREFTLTDGSGTTSGTFKGTADEATTYYALYPYATSTYEVEDITVDNSYLGKIGIDWQELITAWEDFHSKNREKSIDEFIEGVPAFSKMSAEKKAIIKAYLSNEPYKKITKSGVQRNADNQFEEVVLPAEQTVAEGQYVDPAAMLMIGESDDAHSLQFKNVCAYVEVTPTFDCNSISLKSKGTESLAGTLTVDYNNGTPTTTVTANGTNTVTLSGAITADKTYYIAVRPETLESGFIIYFTTADSKYKKSTSKAVTFTRNKVTELGSFATSSLTQIAGKAAATIGGETVNVPWIQLWAGGPKWAVYNVGATSVTDYGGYYCWGGTYNNNPKLEGFSWTNDRSDVLNLSGDTDTATKLWGSNWRMPTKDELGKGEEDEMSGEFTITGGLPYECTCTWVNNYNGTGVNGLLCTGKGDYSTNSIFLPAAGYSINNATIRLESQGAAGNYWSSECSDNYYKNSYYMDFSSNSLRMDPYGYRYTCCSVRAVLVE